MNNLNWAQRMPDDVEMETTLQLHDFYHLEESYYYLERIEKSLNPAFALADPTIEHILPETMHTNAFTTRVKAENLSGVIVDENIGCRFIRNDGVDYSEIELIWTFNDNCMHRLGLHGGYRSDYQEFSFIDGSLVIETDDLITITVY